jgi:hypothetical protein
MQEPQTPPPETAPASSPEPALAPAHIPSEPKAAAPTPPATAAQVQGSATADMQPARKLAGKYGSVEDLEKSYLEAQRRLSERTIDNVETLTQRTGINLAETTNAYLESGQLPLAALEAFAKAGIGAGMAERLIQGEAAKIQLAQTQVQTAINEVTNIAGGLAQRDNVLNWAAGSLSKPDVERLNARLADPSQAPSAMRELMFMHSQAVGAGKARPLVAGQVPAAMSPGFNSTAEVVQAMARVRRQGYVDEETSRRLANTPRNYIEGH